MIRTALVGYGKVAHIHARVLAQSTLADCVAVCGRDRDKAMGFADQHGIPAYDTHLAQLITEQDIQAIIVCTPHPVHAESAVVAAQMGVHVLVEKPLATMLADCDAIIQAANAGGVQIGVISQRRFYEPALRVRQAIDDGKIGKPILGTVQMLGWRNRDYYQSDPWRGTWEHEGGGLLVNQAPHQLDLLLWYMGEPAEVTAYWDNLNHPYIEVEDTAVAIIRFKNGALGNIVLSNSQKPGLFGKVHVHGDNGASIGVQTESGSMFIAGMSDITEPPLNDIWTIPGEEHHLAQWLEDDRHHFEQIDATAYYIAQQVEDFMQAILADRPPAVTAQDGRAVVALFNAIYESQRQQKTIHF
ncbi:MAG: Gfo/Idh/MocA family protein [Anaerolineae bacterium]